MAQTRVELHEILCDILGSRNVYFRPPSIGMKYPCIKYNLESGNARYADDKKYINKNRWSIIVIDEDPDSEIPSKIQELRYCSFDRTYEADGLNHFVHTLYY